ncbi:MAG TPA: TIGR00725 family protein [Caldithrix abyssi]|uniref:TIGR00725 family protein n=1 Tax=Caldithrix abyssi TaxID=187145 RepID=A0A7V5UF96_CALAY|nr:TIGR00725 family protein [Caldithrix abyssi]
MKKLIAVIGGREVDADSEQLAFEVGEEIARRGFGLVCGGMGGVMEAASRGCKQAGGLTVALIPQDDPAFANPYSDIVIPTGLGIARNLLIIRAAQGVVAIDGKYGTLSEIAYALQLGKPIAGINTWQVAPEIYAAKSAKESLDYLVKKLKPF